MERTFLQAIEHRRSIYALDCEQTVPISKVAQIIKTALYNTPSAFNSQSTRVVLLAQENHRELWKITKEALREIVPAESFGATEQKIDNCFASGYGTILFYEDQSVVEGLQNSFPTYSDRFQTWSEHTSAMHQFAIWTMLEDAALGASLQHYNPLIDKRVAERWHINPTWKLIAQMPFGAPTAMPEPREHRPTEESFLLY